MKLGKPEEANNDVSDFFNVNTSTTILVDDDGDGDDHHDHDYNNLIKCSENPVEFVFGSVQVTHIVCLW